MTSLYNRGYGEQSIKELLDKEKKGLFCLFDVDKFKSVNGFPNSAQSISGKAMLCAARVDQRLS